MASADGPTTPTPSARGKPKGDKRDRTRAALLEAARALIREKGHERTTMEEVARRAGMTTGAIYGNFKNRDELFIALGQKVLGADRSQGRARRHVRRGHARVCQGDARSGRRPRAGRRGTTDGTRLRVDQLRAAGARSRGHERQLRVRRRMAAHVRRRANCRCRPTLLVRVLHALIEGLVMQRILTPELFPDEVFYEAFAALAPERPKPTRTR